MWKFHLVHHSDTTVDVTTGLRHHPGEAVFRMVFTIMGVIVVRAPIWIVFFIKPCLQHLLTLIIRILNYQKG